MTSAKFSGFCTTSPSSLVSTKSKQLSFVLSYFGQSSPKQTSFVQRPQIVFTLKGDEPSAQPRDAPGEPAVRGRVPLRQAGAAGAAGPHAHLPGQEAGIQDEEEEGHGQQFR